MGNGIAGIVAVVLLYRFIRRRQDERIAAEKARERKTVDDAIARWREINYR